MPDDRTLTARVQESYDPAGIVRARAISSGAVEKGYDPEAVVRMRVAEEPAVLAPDSARPSSCHGEQGEAEEAAE